ncbi:hypothetical protein DLE60_19795 [Micromonospora globispora]|nr:hypothetical protein DLE60_19795 [Micromonospora globispora]
MSLVGLGIGMGIGARFGSAAVPWAVVVGLVGIALSFVSSREPALTAESQSKPSSPRPQLADLGSRVEQILRLAEEQADNYRKEAEREAEDLVAAARLEAGAIIDTARTEATRFEEVPESDAGDR